MYCLSKCLGSCPGWRLVNSKCGTSQGVPICFPTLVAGPHLKDIVGHHQTTIYRPEVEWALKAIQRILVGKQEVAPEGLCGRHGKCPFQLHPKDIQQGEADSKWDPDT